MFFPIHRVDRQRAQQVEPLGSKPKFWYRDGERRLLFKAEDRGTGEDWAEIVACHLCRLLGLPHVEYELASEYQGDQYLRPGAICENMAPPPGMLVLGNQLLLFSRPDYPSTQRFKVRQHTVDAACEILAGLELPPVKWNGDLPSGIRSAMDVFIGYVLLDAWIANQDRHHENWGALWDGAENLQLSLAPSFDHGAAFARNLMDAERQDRLTTRDKNRSIPTFACKARSAFFDSPEDSKALLLLDAFRRFAGRSPNAAKIWRDRLRAVTGDKVLSILVRVPENRMSEVCRDFTMKLLETNRQRLLESGIAE